MVISYEIYETRQRLINFTLNDHLCKILYVCTVHVHVICQGMGSNQSKPARAPETELNENDPSVATLPEDYGPKKIKTKHTKNLSSEIVLADATEAAKQMTNMETKETLAYSSVVFDRFDKAGNKRGGRKQAKRLQRHPCENEINWKEQKHTKHKSGDIKTNMINTDNVTKMQNSEASSKARSESIVNTCSMNGNCMGYDVVRVKKSEIEAPSTVDEDNLLTNGIYPSDESDFRQDSRLDSNVRRKTETMKEIFQSNDPYGNDKISQQDSPDCNEASKEDHLSKQSSVCTETEFIQTINVSCVSTQGRPVCHEASKESTLTDEATKKITGSSLLATELSKDSQSPASSRCSFSSITATAPGNLPNPILNSTDLLSSATASSNTTATSISNSQYLTSLTTSAPAQPNVEPVSSAVTNSNPPSDASQLLLAPSNYAFSIFSRSTESRLATLTSTATTHTSSGLANIYSQPASSSSQSFTFSGNNNGSSSYSGNNHGNFSFSGNNHGHFSMSTNTARTVEPPNLQVTTSSSNYIFPPSFTNYSRRNIQSNYNSDMYLTTITGGSSNVYPHWNALQTGIEMDGTHDYSSDGALTQQLQNILSSLNGSDYDVYDVYGTANIGYNNSAISRDDSNKPDLDGDYITVRTSIGDTSTRISAKNIKLSPQYRDGLTDENMGIILERPKYPRYATMASRIKSFQDLWPVTNQMSWEQLPEAGFVYTGKYYLSLTSGLVHPHHLDVFICNFGDFW